MKWIVRALAYMVAIVIGIGVGTLIVLVTTGTLSLAGMGLGMIAGGSCAVFFMVRDFHEERKAVVVDDDIIA